MALKKNSIFAVLLLVILFSMPSKSLALEEIHPLDISLSMRSPRAYTVPAGSLSQTALVIRFMASDKNVLVKNLTFKFQGAKVDMVKLRANGREIIRGNVGADGMLRFSRDAGLFLVGEQEAFEVFLMVDVPAQGMGSHDGDQISFALYVNEEDTYPDFLAKILDVAEVREASNSNNNVTNLPPNMVMHMNRFFNNDPDKPMIMGEKITVGIP